MTVRYRVVTTPDGTGAQKQYDIAASTCDVCGAQARMILIMRERPNFSQPTTNAYCAAHAVTDIRATDVRVMDAAPVDWQINVNVNAGLNDAGGLPAGARLADAPNGGYLGFAKQSAMGTAVAPMRDWWTPDFPRPSNWWTRWWAWMREVWTTLDRSR